MTDLTKRLDEIVERHRVYRVLPTVESDVESRKIELIADLRALITEARTQGDEWIKVTPETMPEDGARVQVWDGEFQHTVFYWASDPFPFTHWRHLHANPGGE